MSWLNTSFPWIGLAGAVVLLVLMFTTNLLRSDLSISRWRDLTWLSWAATVVYLLHNAEEYGVDLLGRTYAFPTVMCSLFGYASAAACPVPPVFFTSVNVPMFWLVGPVAALLSKRHPLVGLTLYSVTSINFVVHVAAGIATGAIYNPGWFTAVFLFLPLTAWTVHALFGPGRLSYKALAYLLGWGVFVHILIAVSILPLMKGVIRTAAPAITVQLVNAALLIIAPWLAERWRNGAILRRRDPAEASA
jgi:hypothetical protein